MDEIEGGAGVRIGRLATAAGVTVRTLHHYEEIGLLAASGRTGAGHRTYDGADVARLYRIGQLRRLGLPLASIGEALDQPDRGLAELLRSHRDDLDRQIEALARVRARVAVALASIDVHDPPAPPIDDLLQVLEEMTVLDTNLERRISILVYADLEAAHDWLVRVFGLGPGELTRDDTGTVVHAELDAGDGVVWLHREAPEFGLASPRSLGGATGSMAVMVEDVDAHHRHAASEGAEVVYEPVDQPYGYREYSARDLEGGLWSFMRPLP